jgi:hypothetical protein
MGGAGVAAGTSANATFLNPALLAVKRNGDRFSIELPIVRARMLDQEDFSDALSDFDDAEPIRQFEDAIDAYRDNQTAATENEVIDAGRDLVDAFRSISNKVLQVEANAATVIGVPNPRLGIAVFANAYVVGGVTGIFTDLDQINAIIEDADAGQTLEPSDDLVLDSSVRASFAQISEFGISLAREFDWLGGISLGVTPKIVKVDTYDYSFSGRDLDDIDIDLDQGERNDTGVNVDIGVAKDFGNGWVAGLSVRNLIPQEYDTAEGNQFKLDPMARAGVAFRPQSLQWITLAADLDLTENDPAGLDSETQFLGVGVEFDAFRTAQLRLGYRHNLSDLPSGLDSGMYTAGFGFSPFGAHIDLAVSGNDDDIGAAMQLGFRF